MCTIEISSVDALRCVRRTVLHNVEHRNTHSVEDQVSHSLCRAEKFKLFFDFIPNCVESIFHSFTSDDCRAAFGCALQREIRQVTFDAFMIRITTAFGI